MGLDMYAFATTAALPAAVDFEEPGNGEEIHYWRKHPNLHGWMQALYQQKGGTDCDFNMSTVQLELGDLADLEAAVKGKHLPGTSGFFFGHSDGTEIEDDLAFIATARAAIAEGKSVYYYAWW